MSTTPFKAAGTLALLLASTTQVSAHSLGEARHKLYRLGYYAIEVERASLPYSFTACKRGQRYHIHVNWYGDLEQVDPIGDCRSYEYGHGYRSYGRRYYGRHPYFEGRYRRYRDWREPY